MVTENSFLQFYCVRKAIVVKREGAARQEGSREGRSESPDGFSSVELHPQGLVCNEDLAEGEEFVSQLFLALICKVS